MFRYKTGEPWLLIHRERLTYTQDESIVWRIWAFKRFFKFTHTKGRKQKEN